MAASFDPAPVSIVAPFEYTSLVWAFALGFAIWGDVLIIGNEHFRKRL